MNGSQPRLTHFAHGITAVDTEYVRPQMDASHVIVHRGRAAIVDTGHNGAVPLILAALEELEVAPADVEYLFLTHVHLDHAGGAGALMRALPRATAVVHPRGAQHMIDPGKLIAGTRAVYGDALYDSLYGEILPIARERLVITQEGQRFELLDRVFECVHTPGHALHHQAIVDHGAGSVFTGDTFGVSYRDFDTARGAWIMPTTTPTQFDPVQLKSSLDKIMSFKPRRLYLTHYSEVGDCARLANDMHDGVDAFVSIARGAAGKPDALRRVGDELRSLAHRSLHAHGCQMPAAAIDAILTKDFELNAAGLLAWLAREAN